MLGHHRHDLVERRVDEPVELDLQDGAVAAHRESHRRADDAALRQRRIDHAVLAKVLLQAVGHAEDSAERPNVLPHEQHLGVVLQRPAQARIERLHHRHRRHDPSTAAR